MHLSNDSNELYLVCFNFNNLRFDLVLILSLKIDSNQIMDIPSFLVLGENIRRLLLFWKRLLICQKKKSLIYVIG